MDSVIARRKLVSMISLAMRAGKVITGEDGCLKAVQSGKAHLVLVATDASNNTRKKFADKSGYYGVPCYCYFSKSEVEAAIGKPNRATIAIADEGFAGQMQNLLSNMNVRIYKYENSTQI